MSSVRLEGVEKRFGAVRAVDGVDATIAEGSFTALLGPSGCGKSTLLRLVAGLERPSGGRIAIGDDDVTALAPEHRGVGMMFQSYALFPHMSVAENLAFPLKMKGVRDRGEIGRRIEEALALVRLPGFGPRGIGALSGGQQQRVALARAFIAGPRVLLLDEPLSNLDARLREEMQVELIELHTELRLTTIFVTHDQEEALSLADRVVLMREGRIEQEGSPQDLYASPTTAFAADFIGAANLFVAEIACPDGTWCAEFAGIRVPVPQPADGAGGRRQVMIRQEDIDLVEAPVEGRVNVPGRVQTRVYLGAGARFVVQIQDTRITVVTSKHVRLRAGDACVVSWKRDHSQVI